MRNRMFMLYSNFPVQFNISHYFSVLCYISHYYNETNFIFIDIILYLAQFNDTIQLSFTFVLRCEAVTARHLLQPLIVRKGRWGGEGGGEQLTQFLSLYNLASKESRHSQQNTQQYSYTDHPLLPSLIDLFRRFLNVIFLLFIFWSKE